MNYDNEKKTISTIKSSQKLSKNFGVLCKVLGSDKSEFTRRLWENVLWVVQHDPAFKDAPTQQIVHRVAKKTLSGFPFFKQPPWARGDELF